MGWALHLPWPWPLKRTFSILLTILFSLFCLGLGGGHTWEYSGLTPGSLFRDHSWWDTVAHRGCEDQTPVSSCTKNSTNSCTITLLPQIISLFNAVGKFLLCLHLAWQDPPNSVPTNTPLPPGHQAPTWTAYVSIPITSSWYFYLYAPPAKLILESEIALIFHSPLKRHKYSAFPLFLPDCCNSYSTFRSLSSSKGSFFQKSHPSSIPTQVQTVNSRVCNLNLQVPFYFLKVPKPLLGIYRFINCLIHQNSFCSPAESWGMDVE